MDLDMTTQMKPPRYETADDIADVARLCRKDILNMVMSSHEGHIGGAFSCIDILVALYFQVLNINPARPDWDARDRFILSKGHACFAQYAVLGRRGYYPLKLLDTVSENGTAFGGHPDRDQVPGVDVSTGSLGQGLSIGAGMSIAAKKDGNDSRVFVLLGDGECQEGSIWEAALFAAARSLDKLIAIVDVNSLQAIGKTSDIIPMESFSEKWRAFGWGVQEVNGHNIQELLTAFSNLPLETDKPSAILARTIKGKGVSFMENQIMWHTRTPSDEEYEQALGELERNLTV
jgi:transketolase